MDKIRLNDIDLSSLKKVKFKEQKVQYMKMVMSV